MATDIPFAPEDLNYAEQARCLCGAGMAYVEKLCLEVASLRAWWCSAVLRGEVDLVKATKGPKSFPFKASLEGRAVDQDGTEHRTYPFAFYEIRSEKQPGAGTTRPDTDPPAKSYDEELADRKANLPGVVAGLDMAFEGGLKKVQCWGIAKRLERQPWPNKLGREISTALQLSLRHNPPPLAVCTKLWVALRDSMDVAPNACARCNEPILEGLTKGGTCHQGYRVWHSDCRREEDAEKKANNRRIL